MSKTLYWMQSGGCGGDTWSLLDADTPDLVEFLELLDIEVLWHPALSNATPREHRQMVEAILAGEQLLDVLCVEGAIIRGPSGTGMYDTVEGKPKKNLTAALARQAQYVLALGTCASFGGVGSDGDVEATGLQFTRDAKGGFLGPKFVSKAGLPALTLPGCPVHCAVVCDTLGSLVSGRLPALNEFNSPVEWYDMQVHQGCVRNEYHEYRVEEADFGEKGCLFFHLGCKGPLTHGACNKVLWNRRSSKTQVGVPCVGCTRPDFPQPNPFFRTPNIAGIPIDLPEGVDRAHYLAYKDMAAAAAPARLTNRQTRV